MLKYLRSGMLLSLFCIACMPARAQNVPQKEIFPSLTGNELLDSLKAYYKPASVLNYNDARDKMFGEIYVVSDSVYCVYTGDALFMDPAPGQNPRTYAFEHDPSWNTEHIFPQSKGAGSGKAKSDLHHLWPIRADVNSSRSNYPFAVLKPDEVTRWWKGGHSQTTEPSGDLSLWSKTKSSPDPAQFEVMDETKGNVARAIFYFYTMYRDQADEIDTGYFIDQMKVLRSYHITDEVDSSEVARSYHIAEYQDGRYNPFILDTTLVRRAYFTDYDHDFMEPDDPFMFTATYNFSGTTGCDNQDNEISGNPDSVTYSSFQRTGVICNEGSGQFNSRGWPADGQADAAYYVSFTMTADEARYIEFQGDKDVSFSIRKSGTGPESFSFDYIIDGGAPVQFASGSLSGTGNHSFEASLPKDQSISEMEFLFYAWNAEGNLGTLRFNSLSVTGTTVPRTITGIENNHTAPRELALLQNYPNPFNPSTVISYELPRSSDVHLAVYDMLGRQVAVLVSDRQPAGRYEVSWDAASLASGAYFYRLVAGATTITRTMTLIR